MQLGLQCRFQHADRLSIDVVDGGRREQQRANDPAVAAYPKDRPAARIPDELNLGQIAPVD
jgi:hypothetical protein